MKIINLLKTKSHLHPRQPHTRLCFRRGRAGGNINTTLQPEINQKQFNTILINRYLRMKSNPKHQ